MSKYTPLWKYLSETCTDDLTLTCDEIEKILGFSLDHSFLQYKKELTEFGIEVKKISMKDKTVRFIRHK
ncbi:MAG TPA: hypothetical protein O0X97_04310 [Methanocorpusculum sp.]|nr:hypothetical protein [Methanocorpusculum sp.]